MAAFGAGPLLACTAGLVLLGLLRSPLRWSSAVVSLPLAVAVRAPRRMSSSPTAATPSRCAASPAGLP